MKKKVVIFGFGSIGQRYARILSKDKRVELCLFRSNKLKKKNAHGIREIYDWKELSVAAPQIAIIANPTFLHIQTAVKCAQLNMDLFIEKPLSSDLRGIDKLGKICRQNKVSCYVAYCLRFHPLIKKAKELLKGKEYYHARVSCSSYLPAWRKRVDHKKSYSAFHRFGGGVINDLSHEIDYIEYLLGPISEIAGHFDRVGRVTVDSEDCADLIVYLGSKRFANLHLNFMSLWEERAFVIDFRDGYLKGDLRENTLEFLYRGKRQKFRFPITFDGLLTRQWQYFFSQVSCDKKEMMTGLAESTNLLRKVIRIKTIKKRVYG